MLAGVTSPHISTIVTRGADAELSRDKALQEDSLYAGREQRQQ